MTPWTRLASEQASTIAGNAQCSPVLNAAWIPSMHIPFPDATRMRRSGTTPASLAKASDFVIGTANAAPDGNIHDDILP